MNGPLPAGEHVSAYEILRTVARGTFTTVYQARSTHPQFRDRRVALCVLCHPDWSRHFIQAARMNASLVHPRIAPLYEVGEAGGHRYWVRAWVPGDDLHSGLRDSQLTLEGVVRIATDVADALDYAHGRGTIHGSVHPRHMLMDSDARTWLIGFGEFPPPIEMPVVGNPLHLAPEQFESNPLTPACDVYGLAETCFWLLSGRHPFHGLPGPAVLGAKQQGRLSSDLREHRPDIPADVETVLCWALDPDPRARPASACEFAVELDAAHRAK
jgi:eukaryotic-like serine/threonine-protein kinase